jgi:hypothetical protein
MLYFGFVSRRDLNRAVKDGERIGLQRVRDNRLQNESRSDG